MTGEGEGNETRLETLATQANIRSNPSPGPMYGNPRNFCLSNQKSWALELNPVLGIRNSSSTDKKIRTPQGGIRNLRLSWITFKGWTRSSLLLERKSNQGLPDGLSTRPHCLFVTGKVLQSSETGSTED